MIPAENAWEGLPCFIVGGGPSLGDFDWNWLLPYSRIIAINMAYRDVHHAAVWFSEDKRVIELIHAREDWKAFQGAKVFHALDPSYIKPMLALDPSLQIIERKRRDKYWSDSFSNGLSYSSNSGIGALNIAAILGASPIFLLGFDCAEKGGEQQNYHDEYERAKFDRTGDHQYRSFRSDFEHWAAPHLRQGGKQVVNLNSDSSITCWPRQDRDQFFISELLK